MFTTLFLNALKPKDKPYRRFEGGVNTGFGIQVSSGGTKTFFYYYKVKGKQRFMKLGCYPATSLKEARETYQKWRKVKESGHDPQIVRDLEIQEEERLHQEIEEKKQELKMQGSYQQLLEGYVQDLKSNNKRSWENAEQIFRANAYKCIAKSKKARDVTSDDINRTLAIIENRGAHVVVNRVRGYLSAAFSYGLKSDKSRGRAVDKVLFGIERNPVRDVLKSDVKEKAGERYLTEQEVKRLWFELDDTNISLSIVSALKLLLVTGQRVEEVLRINQDSIDQKTQLWELSKTKNKRPHVVPLSNLAIEIIGKLQPDNDGYLLPSSKGGLMKSMVVSKAVSRYCLSHDFTKFTPRDLRRTWKTLAGKAGISKQDRDLFQNHSLNDVSSEHYDRYDYLAEKRQVATVWNTHLENILGAGSAEVHAINQHR